MSSTAAPAAQESPPGSTQAAKPAPATYAAAAAPSSVAAAVDSRAHDLWANATEAEKDEMANAMEVLFRKGRFCDGATPGSVGYQVHQVRDSLLSHYDGPLARLPFLPDLAGALTNPNLARLTGGTSGARFVRTVQGADGKAGSYMIDVAFSSKEAFQKALLTPYLHRGVAVQRLYAPAKSLEGVSELRFTLPDLNLSPSDITAALTNCLKSFDAIKLLQIQQQDSFTTTGALTTSGNIAAYVKITNFPPGITLQYMKEHLAPFLPTTLTLGRREIAVRHSYEGASCYRCRFAGHIARDCPRFPCSGCGRAGHALPECVDPTRKGMHARMGQGKATHPPPAPSAADRPASAANAAPLSSPIKIKPNLSSSPHKEAERIVEQVMGEAEDGADMSSSRSSEPDTEASVAAEEAAVAQELTGSLPPTQTETQIESISASTQ
ncbi:hypothetical protein JCM10296v2_007338 [Rhodotorula toruloides]